MVSASEIWVVAAFLDKIRAVQSLDFMSFSLFCGHLFTMPLLFSVIPYCPLNNWQCPKM
jgi:hypothetical protein